MLIVQNHIIQINKLIGEKGRRMMKIEITAIPFISGSVCYSLITNTDFEFAYASAIIFGILVLTKQVKLL